MKRLIVLCVALLLAGGALAGAPPAAPAAAPAAAALPGDSVYQLDLKLTGQDGRTQPLAARRGRAQLVTMFYTSCTMVCPMIVDTLKLTRQAVDEPARDRLDVLAVSFDPERDSVQALHDYAARRGLDASHWTLARAEPQDVRPLAALLGLQYRKRPDGDFNHSSELILLDAQGRIVARTDVIGRLDPAFVAAVRKTVAAAP
ncbi:electron transporter SenC [Frateuria sp. Soil773]|uniref:SCO family protein n=1 Tax=Frateuria sp. Soil773 TaxID=1736407 RepID=UPI0006F31C0A|nr:SCO family protein [Frateuria sp. Soil773]KRF01808.1 electron transporter SenC [Frateuria sp. Soil773]